MNLPLAFSKIKKFFLTQKRMPTQREICQLFNYATTASSQYLVKQLIKNGFLEKDSSGKIVPKTLFITLPFLGPIKAGYPEGNEEQYVDSLSIEQYLVENPNRSFLLKVSGDSMINAGINEGDIVIIEKDKDPREGDILAAYIDGAWTLKFLKKDKGQVYLSPANPKYPLFVPKKELIVGGVVTGVVRKYH